MSYNTVNVSIALDFNWALAFLSLIVTTAVYLGYDRVITEDTFDDTYERSVAKTVAPTALLTAGAITGGIPLTVVVLSVFLGPVVIVGSVLLIFVAAISLALVLTDFGDDVKKRAQLTKSTLQTYHRSTREAASNALAGYER
jgi:hypothetical protein